MGKYDLPELPSDEQLGISDEDRKALERDLPVDKPEMTPEELLALLEDAPSTKRDRGTTAETKVTKQSGRAKQPVPAGNVAAAGAGAASPSAARGGMRGPLTLLLVIVVAVLSSTSASLPRPVPANASEDVFSSARAMATLTEIARRPRPIGSPEHTRVRELLLDRLRTLGFDTEVQATTSVIQSQEGVRAATVRNVLGRRSGTASTGAVLVTAHYDSRELAPGAGDDGSGIVAILEALRALGARAPLRNDVIVLFTDAEEIGLLGARAFTADHPWMRDVSVVLSFEMRGGGGPSIMFETGENNGWVVRAMRDFDPRPFANSLAYEVYSRMPNDTDFTPFKDAGKQGLNFAAVGRAHVYHQATDTPENLSEATLQHHGLRALAGLEHFGRADLREVGAPNVVYFSVPLLGLFVYESSRVLPISGGLLLLASLATLLALRSGARPGGVVAGAGIAVLGAALSYGAALGMARWVARFHSEAGSLAASVYHGEGWYMLGLAAAVLALVTTLHALARRWLRAPELQLGAALLPLGFAVALSFAAPLAAMNVQWPVAAALLSATALALFGTRAGGTFAWIVGLAFVVPVLVIWVPLIELLWLTLSFQILGLVAVLMAITLHMSLPAVESFRRPNAWWAPVTGVAACATFVGLGILGARPSAERPAPSTLLYAYEHGSGSAFWATDASADILLDAEAIAWAEAGAGVTFSTTRDLTPFAHPLGRTAAAPAPIVSAARPEVVILRDTLEAERRFVVLGVRSVIGAERMAFQRDSVGRTRFLSVNGVAIERPGAVSWVDHWGVPDGLVVLELDMPREEPIGVHVVEHLHRPQELLGRAFDRPATLAPDVKAGSDRALFRFSIAAFADPRHAFVPAGPGSGLEAPRRWPPDEEASVSVNDTGLSAVQIVDCRRRGRRNPILSQRGIS
jgi:hypothetical protein